MKKIFDIIYNILIAAVFITIFMPNKEFKSLHWIGIAIAVGLGYAISIWNQEKIEKLENEIKQIREKNNYESKSNRNRRNN